MRKAFWQSYFVNTRKTICNRFHPSLEMDAIFNSASVLPVRFAAVELPKQS
jgi:hypothetical protein